MLRATRAARSRSRGHCLGDLGLCGRLQMAYRNGIPDGKGPHGPGRIRDSELGCLASSHSHVPAGRSLPAGLAAGLREKDVPITRPQVYRVVRETLLRQRFGLQQLQPWLMESQLRNERARRSHERRRSTHRKSGMKQPPRTRRCSTRRASAARNG